MSATLPNDQPVLNTPARWTVRVLAWIAFTVVGYLAWTSVSHTQVFGCPVGEGGCDKVLTSRWSTWFGIPVAVVGLACYASLAALSVAAGLTNAQARKWIGTGLVMLSLSAAGAGVWFTALQWLSLGEFCPYCLVVHVCGIAIAAIVLWSVLNSIRQLPTVRSVAPRSVATPIPIGKPSSRTGIPMVAKKGSTQSARTAIAGRPTRPLLAIATAGAAVFLAALIGGQSLYSTETFTTGKAPKLAASVELGGSKGETPPTGLVATSKGPKPYTAERPVTDDTQKSDSEGRPDPPDAKGDDPATKVTMPAAPHKERKVTFLGGKVTLDVYAHPVLGSPEAPHVVLEFASYDCPHCHHMHRFVQKALKRYGDQVAVVVLVIPFGIECNPEIKAAKNSVDGSCTTARMALSMSSLEPEKFQQFHDWLMEGKEKPPAVTQVVSKAYQTVGAVRIKSISREQLNKQITQNVELFTKIKASQLDADPKVGLPLMIVDSEFVAGTPENEEKLFKIWEDTLGVKPINGAEKIVDLGR